MSIDVVEVSTFVNRIFSIIRDNDMKHKRFTFFLGAGCSIQSNVKGADSIVEKWIEEKWIDEKSIDDEAITKGGIKKENIEEWLQEKHRSLKEKLDNSNKPGECFEAVIKEFYDGNEINIKDKIEAIIKEAEPSFGYSVLANLVTHERYGQYFNNIITTNFEDLIADAINYYSNKKPTIIIDKTVKYHDITDIEKNYIVKIHGDLRYETRTLVNKSNINDGLKGVLDNIFANSDVIFVGYRGNDNDVLTYLNGLNTERVGNRKIYWVNDEEPNKTISEWLNARNSTWVKHSNFDELMLLFFERFKLNHPSEKVFNKIFTCYNNSYRKVEEESKAKIASQGDKKDIYLRKALDYAENNPYNWEILKREAKKYEKINPQLAEEIYIKAMHIKSLQNNGDVYYSYALFLKNSEKNYKTDSKACEYFKKAITVEHEVYYIYDYIRNMIEEAQEHEKDKKNCKEQTCPNRKENCYYSTYCICEAKKAFKKLIEELEENEKNINIDIRNEDNSAYYYGRYAIFLKDFEKDHKKAKEYYQKALKDNDDNFIDLGNYAGFLLLGDQSDKSEGMEKLDKAIKKAEERKNRVMQLECHFYRYVYSGNEDIRKESLNIIKELMDKNKYNTRSPGWNFEEHCEAAKNLHDNKTSEFIKCLADVISLKESDEELEKYWRE